MCHNVESWLNIYWMLGGGVRRPTWQSLIDSLALKQRDVGRVRGRSRRETLMSLAGQ